MKIVIQILLEYIETIVLLILVVALPISGIYSYKYHLEFDSGYLFLRIPCLIVLIGAACWVRKLIWQEIARYYFTRWWDPADWPGGPIAWYMVLNLTIGCRDFDPLNARSNKRERRTIIDAPAMVMLGFVIAIGSLLIFGFQFLANPHVPSVFAYCCEQPNAANAAMNLSGNLTALLALIAAAISIYFTYHQLRAKVRADNRQAWIAKLRELIAKVIPLAEEHAKVAAWKQRELRVKLDPLRLELELMLNPSEKDHRLLMYLVQRLSRLNTDEFDDIRDTIITVWSIRSEYESRSCEFDERWLRILENDNIHELVDYAMRVSHVVLKREWERVKNTR